MNFNRKENMNIKRIVAIVGIVLITVFVMSAVVKNKARKLVVQALEESSGGALKYRHLKIYLLRDFPQLELEAFDLALEHAHNADYKVDTLKASIATMKVLSNELNLSSLHLINPEVNFAYQPQLKPKEQNEKQVRKASAAPETQLSFDFNLERLVLKNAHISYQFADSSFWSMRGIGASLSARVNSDSSSIDYDIGIGAFDYKTQDLSLQGIPIASQGHIFYADGMLKLKDADLELAHIAHQLSGQVLFEEQPVFDLKFVSEQSSLQELLTLFSSSSLIDSHLVGEGHISSEGIIKGKYQGLNDWPFFQLQLQSSDASIAYENQTSKIDHLSLSALLRHPQASSLDATVLELDSIEVYSGDNFVRGSVKMRDLVSSPYIQASMSGDVDLQEMTEVFPMSLAELKGQVKADINLAGELQDISDENYAAFIAAGQVKLSRFLLKNTHLPQGLKVDNASFDFSPAAIRLRSFAGALGASDLKLQGSFTNYIAYLFDDDDLKGELSLRSSFLDLNEFKGKSSTNAVSKTTKTEAKPSSPFMVPGGLDLVLNTRIKSLQIDESLVQNCNGKVALKDRRLHLENLAFQAFDGVISLTGSYDTQDKKMLKSNLHVSANDVEMGKAAKTLKVLRQSLPISQFADGKVSTQMSYYGEMDERGTLNLKTLKAKGSLESKGLHIANNPSLNKLAYQLKDNRYKDFTSSPFVVDFQMQNGQLDVAPFDITMVEKKINAGGWYRIDNTINFRVKTTVKAKEIGGDVAKYVAMLSDANKPLPVTIMLKGDAQSPKIEYDTREALNILRKDVTKNLNNDAVKSIIKGFFN